VSVTSFRDDIAHRFFLRALRTAKSTAKSVRSWLTLWNLIIFIVRHLSVQPLSFSFHLSWRPLSELLPRAFFYPANGSGGGDDSGSGKQVAHVKEYPSNYAIRKILVRQARSRGSIAGRGKVRCGFSSFSFCTRLPRRVRQAVLLNHSLRVYFAIITFSRLACRRASSPINGHRSCAKKWASNMTKATEELMGVFAKVFA